ncbi:uncharacterized protein CC84DRAFT_1244862 [Paraphaeosphaeria sporulosa]|uniref:Uncharacterized protein n=1 Tax=Paraphaeosphaeria sporulosa TaxID=1460663 RepID=A0A177CEE2_9PLEO|nr:uncharacterized protein CC84DRAFT_1244862 [Paraphaeosphaeria sporulosa]OAG05995.1 hypothetical protein CC84DRAFT_1244862 [Paraphaeosphaeria sporulosa]
MVSLRQKLALSLFTSGGTAQWLDGKLLGSCADIACPQADNTTIGAACRIANQTYGGVGVDTFPFNASSPSRWAGRNLTWTVAIHDYTNYDPDTRLERTIEKAFFLGSSLDLTTALDFGGCAVILEAYDRVADERGRAGSKSCEEVIGAKCHEELQEGIDRFARAQAGRRFNSTSDACDGLEAYLKSVEGEQSECGMEWTQVRYVPMVGDAAPQPLTREQNASTNCYSTQPKSNNLAFVTNWNNTGTMYINDTIKMINSINLALTVFWNSAGGPDVALESHVSCLWPVDETTRSRETMSSGLGEEDEGAAGRVGTVWAILGAAFVTAWFSVI